MPSQNGVSMTKSIHVICCTNSTLWTYIDEGLKWRIIIPDASPSQWYETDSGAVFVWFPVSVRECVWMLNVCRGVLLSVNACVCVCVHWPMAIANVHPYPLLSFHVEIPRPFSDLVPTTSATDSSLIPPIPEQNACETKRTHFRQGLARILQHARRPDLVSTTCAVSHYLPSR